MPRRDLTDLLQEVVEKEGIVVDKTVLPLVVRAAAGSARDGLSILDQVLASAGEEGVTREAAAGLLGVTPDTLLDDVIDAFAARDAAAVFAAVDLVMERGHDPRRFAQDVLERLRDLVVLDAVPDAGAKGLLDCPVDQLERMGRQATMLGTAGLSRAADLFHEGLTEMRGTTAPRLLLELVCARVLLPAAAHDASAVLTRIERLERRLDIAAPATPGPAATPSPPAAATAPAVAAPHAAPVVEPAQSPATPAPAEPPAGSWPATASVGPEASEQPTPQPAPTGDAPTGGLDATALRHSWDAVLDAVKERKKTTHAQLLNAHVLSLNGSRLTLAFTHAPVMRQFQNGVSADVLKEALQASLGIALDIACVVQDDAPAPVASP